jgi:plastocyanin
MAELRRFAHPVAVATAAAIAMAAALVGAFAGRAAAGSAAGAGATASGASSPRVDPRAGGFQVGLGEWAITAEARAIRPGRVTFVVRNSGRFQHGLEIKLRGESGGRGSRDELESIQLRPGQSTTMTLELAPGVYELECFVDDHDDRGMYGLLDVRADAPLVAKPTGGRSAVQIAGFAFEPSTLRTTVGSVVTWRNADPAPHTATGRLFSSPQLRQGGTYRHRFTRAGTYPYVCALHPGMRGTVVVQRRRTA